MPTPFYIPMKRSLLICFVLYWNLNCTFAQSPELHHLKKTLPLISDSTRRVDAMNRLAMLFYEQSADSTFYYAKQARALADRLDYAKGKADALNNLGVFFDIKGNLQMALRYYDEGYTAYRAIGDSANCVQAQMNIAMVYKAMGKEEKALDRFNLALEQGKQLKKDSILSLAIYNYLLVYPERFTRDSMQYYVSKAQAIARKYNDYRVLLAIEQLEANALIASGQKEKGLIRLDSAIVQAVDKKLYYASMDMMIGMGDILLEHNPKHALVYYERALTMSKDYGYGVYTRLIIRKLFDFYAATENSERATFYAKQLLVLDDEQQELDNASSVDYLDYALKEGELTSLKRRAADQLKLLILAIASLLLVFVILLMIRKNLLRTRNFNARLLYKNKELSDALLALEQSHEDNTRLIKTVAHDLRNPIGGMYSIAGLMIDEPGRSDSDREMLELIRTSGNNSLQLVDDLLKLQFKVETLTKQPVELAEMLEYCVGLLQPKAYAKDQELSLQAVQVQIPANRERLWRVVSNLIANAIKFSPRSSHILVQMKKLGDSVRIAVSDQGIGIPEELRAEIFDLFTNAKRQGTAGEESYGMGLAISKQIIEAHKGSIWFEANTPKGTTFFVELPLK